MTENQGQQERRNFLRRRSDQFQDEISLVDLYLVLVRRKKEVIVTLVVVILLAIIYLLLATKLYQARAMLLEPRADQLTLTNSTVVNPNLNPDDLNPLYKPKEIFEAFKVEVKQRETWNKFIKANSELFTDGKKAIAGRSDNNPFLIDQDKDYPGPHIVLKFNTQEKDQAAQVLGEYLKFSKTLFTSHLIKQHKQDVQRKIASLESRIKASRVAEKQKREDEITRLENDLIIARKLNIKDNKMLALQDKSTLTVVASNLDIPRYMRGTRVLTAELEALKNRSSDDAFIKGLRDWQREVARLKQIAYLPENFEPYILDGQIKPPGFMPAQPKIRLVLVLSIVLGIFLGIFAAFFSEFIKKAAQTDQ
jgi:chain length determinant protein (polysaccharide antigen chain regulator)